MELIVKIGGDQAGLAATVERMKAAFKNANVSMPMSWGAPGAAPGAGAAWNAAAKGAEGGDDGGDILSKSGVKRLFGLSLKGGLLVTVIAEFKEFWNWLTTSFSEQFWNNRYGLSEGLIKRIKDVHDVLKKNVTSVLGLREKEAEKNRADILENASPQGRVDLLERDRKAARLERDAAARAYAEAQKNSAEATGYNGAPLTTTQKMQLAGELAKAEENLIKARMKAAGIEQDLIKAYDAVATDAAKEKAREKKETLKPREERDMNFQADAMAQAGLFTKSALLLNPNFSYEQESLNVLREIATNTREGIFTK